MRVVMATEYGGPEVLRVEDVPVPEPGEGEVLVQVAAAGTNPADAQCRAGAAAQWFDAGPHVWGWDFAGTVAGLGPGVTRWRAGDAVFGMPLFPRQARAYAEYLVCPADEIAAPPSTLTLSTAAALPLCGLTALQVVDRCDVRPGHRVLVNGAAGGVGRYATQLAAERGATVVGVARAAHHEQLRRWGVAELVDHTTTDVAATVRGVDVVVDCVGDDGLLACVGERGVIAPVPGAAGGPGTLEETAGDRVRVVRHVVHPDAAGLGRLAALVDLGRLQVGEPTVRPLEEARQVHADLDAGRTAGKVVLEVTR